ncbi:microfibril-associated glycoprotein 4-like [Ylistrum balloti]|uniref:microfibril-associated glycoprotein 4-like n=1 Tax=Ylistrum balloti TaxID=509963 RepID=UPI0029058061|nr:microfibril-associated glycoprotein 4-like [Ylistrum balloti]
MAWFVAALAYTVFGVVHGSEISQMMWNVERVDDIKHASNNTNVETVTFSRTECVLIALRYNLSVASYDQPTQLCVLYNITKHRELMNKTNVLLVREIQTCDDLDPVSISGVYRIAPVPEKSFDVYCDMESEGGPWTVIQNRENDEVDFFRDWNQYKYGFGNLHGNFWLGNDNIYSLTETPCILRVHLETLNGTFGYAEYSEFQISNETEGYKISINGFSGNISDALKVNDGQKFSTVERDHDNNPTKNCAEARKGPWWHKNCTRANLNGLYNATKWILSVYWKGLYGQNNRIQLRKTRMMLKRP